MILLILFLPTNGGFKCDISKNKVKIASDFFPVRKTFVAPIFPEPIFLTSSLKKIFVIIKPNGIEPDKYDKENIKSISIVTVN